MTLSLFGMFILGMLIGIFACMKISYHVRKSAYNKTMYKRVYNIRQKLVHLLGIPAGVVVSDSSYFLNELNDIKRELSEYFGYYMSNYDCFVKGHPQKESFWKEYEYFTGTVREIEHLHREGLLKQKGTE